MLLEETLPFTPRLREQSFDFRLVCFGLSQIIFDFEHKGNMPSVDQ